MTAFFNEQYESGNTLLHLAAQGMHPDDNCLALLRTYYACNLNLLNLKIQNTQGNKIKSLIKRSCPNTTAFSRSQAAINPERVA